MGGELKGPTAVGSVRGSERKVELRTLNEQPDHQFGKNFKSADQLFLDSVRKDAVADDGLRQAAMDNSIKRFKYVFSKALHESFVDRMEQNEDIFNRFMADQKFQPTVEETLVWQAHGQIRNQASAVTSSVAEQ